MMEPNRQQAEAIRGIRAFLNDPRRTVYRLHGIAGSGKTWTVSQAAPEAVFTAPTGKAAEVLRRKGVEARTLHSLIYRAVPFHVRDSKGQAVYHPVTGKPVIACYYVLKEDHYGDDGTYYPVIGGPVVVDEASMVSGRCAEDLLSFGHKVIALGDSAQLPPVMETSSPLLGEPDFELTEPMRVDSRDILHQVNIRIRGSGRFPELKPGASDSLPFRYVDSFCEDVSDYDPDSDQVIVGLHRTRRRINSDVRLKLGRADDWPEPGDRVICRQNDHTLGIFNGQQFTVTDCFQDPSDTNMFRLDLESDGGGRVLVDRVWKYGFEGEDYDTEKSDGGMLFNYAYAITCHSAQGSEWPNVFIIDEGGAFRGDRGKWRYTAATRAQNRVTVCRNY